MPQLPRTSRSFTFKTSASANPCLMWSFVCKYLEQMLSGLLFVSFLLHTALGLMQSQAVHSSHHDHLVVLVHGIQGDRNNLNYLASRLESFGCVVLKSSSNENSESFKGVEAGASNLAMEIHNMLLVSPELKRISIVGNSLGGLYARYVLKHLYNPVDQLVAGLVPQNFLVSIYMTKYILQSIFSRSLFLYLFIRP